MSIHITDKWFKSVLNLSDWQVMQLIVKETHFNSYVQIRIVFYSIGPLEVNILFPTVLPLLKGFLGLLF